MIAPWKSLNLNFISIAFPVFMNTVSKLMQMFFFYFIFCFVFIMNSWISTVAKDFFLFPIAKGNSQWISLY